MLPSIYRLPKQNITNVMRSGIRTHTDTIHCMYLKTTQKNGRLSILVTKKFSKKAVERNSIKRQLFMAFLPFLKDTSKPMDIFCKITQPLNTKTFAGLQKTVG